MRILLPLFLALMLSSCAGVDQTNQLIADGNAQRLQAYADGMAGCGDNAACQVGLTAAFAGGLGQQQFFKPDTAVDYLRAGLPYADILYRSYAIWGGGGGTSGDRAVNYIKGDGNTLLIGNRTSSDNGSTASLSLNPSYTRRYDGGGNRNYTGLQPITDEGLQ